MHDIRPPQTQTPNQTQNKTNLVSRYIPSPEAHLRTSKKRLTPSLDSSYRVTKTDILHSPPPAWCNPTPAPKPAVRTPGAKAKAPIVPLAVFVDFKYHFLSSMPSSVDGNSLTMELGGALAF